MSATSGPPPSATQIHAKAMTAMQDITIRLLKLPDILQTNAKPVKLSGTVIGQNPDGSVQLSTDRGVITMMLKDKASFQSGQKFEIEIPAGRPPQQAALRAPPAQSAQPQQPSILPHRPDQIAQPPLVTVYPPGVKLERPPSLRGDDLAEALASARPEDGLKPPAAPLVPGQILRMTPIPVAAQLVENGNFPIETTPDAMLKTLINIIEQVIDLPDDLRQNFTQILSRTDLTSLLSQLPKNLQPESQKLLETALQKLPQGIDLPEYLPLKNVAFQNGSAPSISPNLTKPMDVQILGFQSGNFQSVLNAQTGKVSVLPFSLLAELPKSMTAQPAPAQPLPQPVSPPVTAPSTPGQTAAAPPLQTPPPAPVFLGQVTGFTPQGQPVIALALPGAPQLQNYAIQFAANNLTEGAAVIVTPLPAAPLSTAPTQTSLVPFPIGGNQPLAGWAKNEIWESLQSLISNIAQINPAAAQTMIQMLPNPAQPQNMGALSLFFLAVMRSGDLDSWVGPPNVNLLRQSGKIDALRSLAGDSTVTNRLDQTLLPNDWRAAVLPFWNDGQVHKLPVYYKQWQDEQEDGDKVREQRRMRFLFNLQLSRMGDVQVDGFLQKEKLDMILRTKAAMSVEMQQAMKITYTRAMERSNLAGEITFQFKPEQWVDVTLPA